MRQERRPHPPNRRENTKGRSSYDRRCRPEKKSQEMLLFSAEECVGPHVCDASADDEKILARRRQRFHLGGAERTRRRRYSIRARQRRRNGIP